jgi:DNA-binding GntR family transcriptional regulator
MYTVLDTQLSTPLSSVETLSARRSDDAYSVLKTRLLRGEFPLNMRLVETRIAQDLGVSRTPVREALARLAADSLLRPHSDGGFTPLIPDTDAIKDLYEVRSTLELDALRRPQRTDTIHQRAILESLHDVWTDLVRQPAIEPSPEFVILDEAFHVTLALSAGNKALAELLVKINDRIRVIRMQDFLDPTRIQLTIEEHLSIVESVLEGNIAAAEETFKTHLAASYEFVSGRASAAIARMAFGTPA